MMQWYDVTIGAYVENTLSVNAETPAAAVDFAKQQFLRQAQSAETYSIEFTDWKVADEQQ